MAKKVQKRRKKRINAGAHAHVVLIEKVLKSLIAVVIIILIAILSYFNGYQTGRDELTGKLRSEKLVRKQLERNLQSYQNQTAAHEYEAAPPKEEPLPKQRREVAVTPVVKPLMAIILDDVSFAHDVKNIRALGFPVTMSFLPPSVRHPDSARLAQDVPHYMVHLPLQAKNFNHEEPDTLHVGDSMAKMEDRIIKITEEYPKVRFVNNHTGSLFTEDADSMKKLLSVLDRYGITFIDSRTTGKSVLPSLMKSRHMPYISRDVFLDHTPDLKTIKHQIAQAVKIAKKYGFVIAIGHPHKVTLQALRESKAMLHEVELVQIDTLVAHMKQ